MTPEPTLAPAVQSTVRAAAARAAARAASWLFAQQSADGHWCAELETNVTITAEYVFLFHVLGELAHPSFRERLAARGAAIQRHVFRNQKADGSFGIATNHAGDLSTTAEAYLALRLLEVPVEDERMRRAERFILAAGGLRNVRVFTRIHLACFGLFPWSSVPTLLPEMMVIPKQFPINIYRFSSWARGTIVPMLVLFHHRPTFALPDGTSPDNSWLDHLWLDPSDKKVPYRPALLETIRKDGVSWRTFFTVADSFTGLYDRFHPGPLRRHSTRRAVDWVKERIEDSGDIAGIWPVMFYGTLALVLTGHAYDAAPVDKLLGAIERFGIDDAQGFRVQACVSPVWDTALALSALLRAGERCSDPRLLRARQWLTARQVLHDRGDWKVYNPKAAPGGWSFEYDNTWYPDVDDTAAVLLAILEQEPRLRGDANFRRAVEWMVSMQNPDGGFAAFDVRNDKRFLDEIPFSDMESLSDPSSPDVTGRVLHALGALGDPAYAAVVLRGIAYLRTHQEPEGSWYGRWGVNYVYGTALALAGLAAQGVAGSDDAVQRGIAWLRSVQNADGGFGEGLDSYRDRSRMGIGPSTASQTAWGLLGLLAFVSPGDETVLRAVRWLTERQRADGTWDEAEFTGTGFPNHFYIRYHLYRHTFPLTALGRFAEAWEAGEVGELLRLTWGTVVHRPYVCAFFLAYAVLGLQHLGVRRWLGFTLSTFAVAFLAEYSSTRNGFPFGLYHYIETTRDRELWLANVPVWDSLSFVFLSYFSMVLAAALLQPRSHARFAERLRAGLRSFRTPLLGGLLMMLLDVVIDPIALRGDRWFLGRVYYYPEAGPYFGVTLANFAGWFAVGFTSQWLFQLQLAWLPWYRGPWRPLPVAWLWLVFAVYTGVLLFMLAVTVGVQEWGLALASTGWILLTLLAIGPRLQRRSVAP